MVSGELFSGTNRDGFKTSIFKAKASDPWALPRLTSGKWPSRPKIRPVSLS